MHGIAHILLKSTAMERWEAFHRMGPRSALQDWFVLLGVVAMLVLLLLLAAISYRRRQKRTDQTVETFGGNAQRRGLNVRERQILLAVAQRSGLPDTPEIFHEVEAFHRGAGQLLAEWAQTRTPPEMEELKAQIARLRRKLGFQKASGGAAATARAHQSTRAIPIGGILELTDVRDRKAAPLRVEVVRNDEREMAVLLKMPRESNAGEAWLARYFAGMSAWEFRTTTLRRDGLRLVLAPSGEVRVSNRRRFPRVAVHLPALLTHLPLLRPERAADATASLDAEVSASTPTRAAQAPTFVESFVTELAGPGLRLETSLQVHVDDRVLIVLQLPEGHAGVPTRGLTVAAVGRVKHGRDIEHGQRIPDAIDHVWDGSPERDFQAVAAGPLSVAVELTGLSDEEIEELASLTQELSARTAERHDNPGQEDGNLVIPVVPGAERAE
jgi:hypothetical protein